MVVSALSPWLGRDRRAPPIDVGGRLVGLRGDGAELDVPVDLGVDLAQLAGCLERVDPTAHVTEGDGLALYCHVLITCP